MAAILAAAAREGKNRPRASMESWAEHAEDFGARREKREV